MLGRRVALWMVPGKMRGTRRGQGPRVRQAANAGLGLALPVFEGDRSITVFLDTMLFHAFITIYLCQQWQPSRPCNYPNLSTQSPDPTSGSPESRLDSGAHDDQAHVLNDNEESWNNDMHLNGSVWCNRGRWCIFCPRSSSWRGEGENHVRAVGELGTAELHDPLRVDYLIRTCTS